MPFLQNQIAILLSKLLGSRELFHFEPLGFAQFYDDLNIEHGLAIALANVYMDWQMLVAVKEKLEAFFLEYLSASLDCNTDQRSVKCQRSAT